MRLCRVGDRLIAVSSSDLGAWSLPVADGVVLESAPANAGAAKARVRVLEDPAAFENRLLIAGCDPAVTVLARHLQREKVTLVMEHQNSSKSLELLKRGAVHIAGTHIRDQHIGRVQPGCHREPVPPRLHCGGFAGLLGVRNCGGAGQSQRHSQPRGFQPKGCATGEP